MSAPSAIWLTLILLLAVSYAAQQWRRSSYSLWENCLYLPTYLLGRLLWRVEFQNSPPGELQSGAILAANHRSSVDPFFIQLAAGRRVHWMVAKEYCQHPVFGLVLKPLQVIPTNRSGMDTAATKAAVRLAKEGRLVGMFPEGRLNRTPALLQPIRAGTALVAARARVPIIPLLITGSPMGEDVWSPILMPARVKITFGTPIIASSPTRSTPTDPPPTKADAGELTMLQWGRQLAKLAGLPDFPVQFASAKSRRRRS